MRAVRTSLERVTRRAEEVRTPGSRLPGVERLVVVRHDRLGDVVLTIPAVAALRRAYPRARLAWMVEARWRPLAAAVDGVDDVLDAPSSLSGVRRALAAFAPDLVVCVSRWAPAALGAALAGVRHRVGPGRRWYAPLLTRRVSERRRQGRRHEAEYALSFAHRAGAEPGPARFPIRLPESGEAEAEGWLRSVGVDPGFVLIHPGSGGSCPGWPPGHFVRLGAELARQGRRIVFSVGPGEREVAERLDASGPGAARAPRVPGGVVLLAAVARRAGLVVAGSTGPLHLAAAVGTATLGIYARWASCGPERWGPYAANGRALVVEAADAARGARRPGRARVAERMASLGPETVARVVDGLPERPAT